MRKVCSRELCNAGTVARGLCRKHYKQDYDAKLFTTKKLGKRHQLTEVNENTAKANCSECGPVQIRVRQDGRGHECWEARRNRQRVYYATGGGSTKKLDKYNLTKEEYEYMKIAQNNLCAICKKPPTDKALAIDHDHESGVVRQLLCTSCNLALGLLQDSSELALEASKYLEKHRS